MFARYENVKVWFREKSKSTAFQITIGVGQGLGLGSGVFDAIGKVITVSNVAGTTATVLGGVNYGAWGVTTVVMTLATYTWVNTNIRNEASHETRIKELVEIIDGQSETIQQLRQEVDELKARSEIQTGKLMIHEMRADHEHETGIEHLKISQEQPTNTPEIQQRLKALAQKKNEDYHALHMSSIEIGAEKRLQTSRTSKLGQESDSKNDNPSYHPKRRMAISIAVNPDALSSNVDSPSRLFGRRNSESSFPNSLVAETEMAVINIGTNSSADELTDNLQPKRSSSPQFRG